MVETYTHVSESFLQLFRFSSSIFRHCSANFLQQEPILSTLCKCGGFKFINPSPDDKISQWYKLKTNEMWFKTIDMICQGRNFTHQHFLLSSSSFPKQALFFHICSKSLLKTQEKGEITCNEQFLLLPQCFLPCYVTFAVFFLFQPVFNSFHLYFMVICPSLNEFL